MTLLTAVIFLIAFFEVSISIAVLRAAPERYDNRVFAAMGIIDGSVEALRGILLLEGGELLKGPCLSVGVAGNIIIVFLNICFAYSFPFNRRPPRSVLAAAAIPSAMALFLGLHSATATWFLQRATYLYFVPYFLWTLRLLYQNFNKLNAGQEHVAIAIIMIAFVFRWSFAMFTFVVGPLLSASTFNALVTFDATGAVLTAQILMGYAILKSHLFRLRGIVASFVLYAVFGATLLTLVAFSIDFVLRSRASPTPSRALLVLVALVPVSLLGLANWLRPRIEPYIVCYLDPRRAQRRGVLERVLDETAAAVDPESVAQAVKAAIVEITGGGKVRFLRSTAHPQAPPDGDLLGSALVEHLASSDRHVHRSAAVHLRRFAALGISEEAAAEFARTPGDLLVPVARGKIVYGALSVEGGELDRDSVLTALTLADQLALKIENYGLFAMRKKLEHDLAESQRLASLGAFAAAIAHEIRTPLTSIQMNVQILQSKVNLPPSDMEYFDITQGELRRLDKHISEILDYAKPMQLHALPTDIRDIADETLRGVEPLLAVRRVRLERDHADGLPQVTVDTQRMRQVLTNLLDNAANASPEGGSVMLRTRRSDDGRVALEITDHGRGIRPEDMPKIFEPFFTTRADGTGLGLAIAQKIVRAHGAELIVQSTPGHGAIFTVLFPRAA